MTNFRQNLKKLKFNDNTKDKYVEAGNAYNLGNATKEANKQNQTLKKDIHAVSLQ